MSEQEHMDNRNIYRRMPLERLRWDALDGDGQAVAEWHRRDALGAFECAGGAVVPPKDLRDPRQIRQQRQHLVGLMIRHCRRQGEPDAQS